MRQYRTGPTIYCAGCLRLVLIIHVLIHMSASLRLQMLLLRRRASIPLPRGDIVKPPQQQRGNGDTGTRTTNHNPIQGARGYSTYTTLTLGQAGCVLHCYYSNVSVSKYGGVPFAQKVEPGVIIPH